MRQVTDQELQDLCEPSKSEGDNETTNEIHGQEDVPREVNINPQDAGFNSTSGNVNLYEPDPSVTKRKPPIKAKKPQIFKKKTANPEHLEHYQTPRVTAYPEDLEHYQTPSSHAAIVQPTSDDWVQTNTMNDDYEDYPEPAYYNVSF